MYLIHSLLRPRRGVAQAAEGFAQGMQPADDLHDLVGGYGRLLLAVELGQQVDHLVAEGFQVPGLLVFGDQFHQRQQVEARVPVNELEQLFVVVGWRWSWA